MTRKIVKRSTFLPPPYLNVIKSRIYFILITLFVYNNKFLFKVYKLHTVCSGGFQRGAGSSPGMVEARIFYTFKEPMNRFQGINSASQCSLAGRYDNPILTRFLAPIDCSKIPALYKSQESLVQVIFNNSSGNIFLF